MRILTLVFCLLLLLLLLPGWAFAQITLGAETLQSSTDASTRSSGGTLCSDPQGGPLIPSAASTCSDSDGNSAAASVDAIVQVDERGGDFSLSGNAAGAAVVGFPGPNSSQAIGNASLIAGRSWTMASDTLYSLSISTTADFEGAAADANASASFSGGTSASGLVTAGQHSLNATLLATAVARETGPLTGAASSTVEARIRFAPANSATLIQGTILGGGVGRPGFLVEAFDGATLVDSALTGDDGSYLLPDVPLPVSVRASDPSGEFAATTSALLVPPATFDADLAAVPVPAMSPAMLGVLASVLAGIGIARQRRHR